MGLIVSLLLGFLPALLFAAFVYWLDRYEKEPIFLLGGVFVWGAMVAAGGAFILNTIFGIGVFWLTDSFFITDLATASVSAPLIEETLKGFAILLVFLIFRREFDNYLDGFVYASIVALGFAATENAYYIYNYGYVEEGWVGVLVLSFIRNVLVGWQHPAYTAFIGFGLAAARMNRSWFVRIGAPLLGWGLAVFTHALHNTLVTFAGGPLGILGTTFLDWMGWIFIFGIVVWATFREAGFMVHYLREEVTLGVITKEQYQTATSAIMASIDRWRALFQGRYFATSRFYQLCAELSHKKRQAIDLSEVEHAGEIFALRKELHGLSAKIA